MFFSRARLFFAIACSLILVDSRGQVRLKQSKAVKIGAYYFDGWSSAKSIHLTRALTDAFKEREPKWGWITSTQEILNEQIKMASDMGLSFFSFCWYFNAKKNTDSSNKALGFYLKSPARRKLNFCLMVANHAGYEIGPNEWPLVAQLWIKLFKTKSYTTVGGKPLIIFFSVNTLVSNFGGANAVHKVFDSLKGAAVSAGLKGVVFAACVAGDNISMEIAKACGFDIFTGYSYSAAGFGKQKSGTISIDSMLAAEKKIWDYFPKASSLPYIPVATLNYDPRPWANSANNFASAPYYVGFSPNSVYRSVSSIREWIIQHPCETTKEKIGLLYAWNEYGEGAYLTPTKKDNNLPQSVQKALLIK